MQKLSKIHLSLIGALALIGCDNVGGTGENSQVRQNKLTISNTPVFPHSGNGDVYALVLSNHTKEDMQLTNSQLKGISPSDEDSADDISSKLQLAKSLKATQLTDLIDLSACQTIKAGSNCIVTIQLPKQVASGYFDFSLQYTDSKSKPYTVDKLVVFNAEMLAKDGLILTNEYIESVVVNSDKYTLAIPFQLTDDFESITIRQHGVAPSGYNQIICNNQVADEEANNSKYAANNSCTALIELDGHEANPELGLATSDASGLERFIEIKSSVLYGNYPELVALGAPVILRTASTQPIYIKNIGTQAAKDIQLAEAGDTASFTVSKTQCAGKTLENNQQCFVQYQAKGSNQTASMTQTISYKGDDGLGTRMFSAKYPVYINKIAPLKRPNQNNTTVLPAHRAIDTQKEYFPEELENITVTFDQPVNASGLYLNDGGMGVLIPTFNGCQGYTYLTPGSIVCKLSAFQLMMLAGEFTFEMRAAQLGNSAGVLQNAAQSSQQQFKYVVRHYKNPRVTAVTNTSQTFKPGDAIKFKVTLDTSLYNKLGQYRFNPGNRYTFSNNPCRTTTTSTCTIDVEYAIPPAAQLIGSGTVQHKLPSEIFTIAPMRGAKPSSLTVSHNLTISVDVMPPMSFQRTKYYQIRLAYNPVLIMDNSNGRDGGHMSPKHSMFLNSTNVPWGVHSIHNRWRLVQDAPGSSNVTFYQQAYTPTDTFCWGVVGTPSVPGSDITQNSLSPHFPNWGMFIVNNHKHVQQRPCRVIRRADGTYNIATPGGNLVYTKSHIMSDSLMNGTAIVSLNEGIGPDDPRAIWRIEEANW